MDVQPILLRLPTIMRITGLARSTIYKLISQNQFPVPIKLSKRAVAWIQSEIETWVSSRARTELRPQPTLNGPPPLVLGPLAAFCSRDPRQWLRSASSGRAGDRAYKDAASALPAADTWRAALHCRFPSTATRRDLAIIWQRRKK